MPMVTQALATLCAVTQRPHTSSTTRLGAEEERQHDLAARQSLLVLQQQSCAFPLPPALLCLAQQQGEVCASLGEPTAPLPAPLWFSEQPFSSLHYKVILSLFSS